jgi:uncharacterized protein with NRDE domain
MCLLIALAGVHPDAPLVFAANRDEWLARPAVAMSVLRAAAPRIIGGRDDLAGGTWLAANEHGVVAALTNRPTAGARDPARRSRGELPIALAGHASARAAVAAFAARDVRSEEYNPCWILVGDRESLHYVDLTRPGTPASEELGRGVWVLENSALRAPSGKARWVERAVAAHATWRGERLVSELWKVLGSHEVPPEEPGEVYDAGFERPAATRAACVHAGPYGTRWSAVVRVGAGGSTARPDVRYTDGPPHESRPQSAEAYWEE